MRRFAALLLSTLAVWASCGTGPSHAETGDPKVYMAWRAPYGTPGALASIPPTCPDSARRDTLYLSFELTQPESVFIGAGADLFIQAESGDTLGSFWEMGRGGRNHGGLTAWMQAGEDMPEPLPWASNGTGNIKFERTATMAHIYAAEVMPMRAGLPIEVGKRYVFARLVFYARGRDLTGCDRPVCMTWRRGEFVFGPTRDVRYEFGPDAIVTRGGSDAACRLGGIEWHPATESEAAADTSHRPVTPREPKSKPWRKR